MIKIKEFEYQPNETEAEKASNSYLMSMVVVIAGLPLPIVNLIAAYFYYVANKKSSYFVRWHCIQSLVAQIVFFICNSILFYWTISIFIFDSNELSNNYIAYLLTVVLFDLVEFIASIYSAIQTRKGRHVEWWFFSDISHSICRK
jgi:uncharacterized Tic20 family protein